MPDVFRTTWQEVVGNRSKIYNFAGASSGHHYTFWKEIERRKKKKRLKFLSSALCVRTLTVWASFPVHGKVTVQFIIFWYLTSNFPDFPACFCFLFNGYRISSSAVRWSGGRSVNFVTCLHLVLSLRMSEGVLLHPLYPFTEWTGTSLFFVFWSLTLPLP